MHAVKLYLIFQLTVVRYYTTVHKKWDTLTLVKLNQFLQFPLKLTFYSAFQLYCFEWLIFKMHCRAVIK